MKQRLGLHVENRRVLGRVRDLENPLAAVTSAQSKVLIPLAIQRVGGCLDVEGPLGNFYGFGGRKRRGLGFQDAFGSGSGLRGGGHGLD